MTRRAGELAVAADFVLPGVSTGYGAGTNTVTAVAWDDLPSTSCQASIVNPHPTASLVVWVQWGAWMAASESAVRICPRVSGSIAIGAGIGSGRSAGWGEIPMTTGAPNPQQKCGSATFTIPASATAATFIMQAYRDAASGTQQVNYPTLRVVPLAYDLPIEGTPESPALPAPVTTRGGSTSNVVQVTSNSWAVYPTHPVQLSFVNSASYPVVCLVTWSAQMYITNVVNGYNVQICPQVSGATTIPAGYGAAAGGPVGPGNIPMTQPRNAYITCNHSAWYILQPGTSVFDMYAKYSDSSFNGPVLGTALSIVPLYYDLS